MKLEAEQLAHAENRHGTAEKARESCRRRRLGTSQKPTSRGPSQSSENKADIARIARTACQPGTDLVAATGNDPVRQSTRPSFRPKSSGPHPPDAWPHARGPRGKRVCRVQRSAEDRSCEGGEARHGSSKPSRAADTVDAMAAPTRSEAEATARSSSARRSSKASVPGGRSAAREGHEELEREGAETRKYTDCKKRAQSPHRGQAGAAGQADQCRRKNWRRCSGSQSAAQIATEN